MKFTIKYQNLPIPGNSAHSPIFPFPLQKRMGLGPRTSSCSRAWAAGWDTCFTSESYAPWWGHLVLLFVLPQPPITSRLVIQFPVFAQCWYGSSLDFIFPTKHSLPQQCSQNQPHFQNIFATLKAFLTYILPHFTKAYMCLSFNPLNTDLFDFLKFLYPYHLRNLSNTEQCHHC